MSKFTQGLIALFVLGVWSTVCVAYKIGIGTFPLDPFMLTFLGYSVTLWLFKKGGPISIPTSENKKYWAEKLGCTPEAYNIRRMAFVIAIAFGLVSLLGAKAIPLVLVIAALVGWSALSPKFRRIVAVASFPLSIVSLWLPGALAYWGVITSVDAYSGLIPVSWIGMVGGNDFMWNGLVVTPIFGGRLVPEILTPTYNACIIGGTGISAFSVFAILNWLAMPFIMGYAVLCGQFDALAGLTFWQRRRQNLKFFGLGLLISGAVVAVTAFLVRVCG